MKPVIIVDAFSSGSPLAKRFAARGFQVHHLVSSENLPEILLKTRPAGIFSSEMLYQSDMDRLLDWAAGIDPVCIVAGTETGVPLADKLAAIFGLPGNSYRKTSSRRNKYDMIQLLHDNGIPAAEHFKSTDLSRILIWISGHGGYPKVIKPLQSAGSDCVTVCMSDEDCRHAFNRIHKTENRLGLCNTEVLVEEYLSGPEFMINAVRCRRKTIITDYGYSKRIVTQDGCLIYDGIEILSFEKPEYSVLASYFTNVLDALEIDFGAAHGEVKLTERGPVLIEVGARLPGGGISSMVEACSTYSPFDAVVDSYCFPSIFEKYCAEGIHHLYVAEMVFLISHLEGQIARPLTAADFTDISSMERFFWDLPAGKELKVTKDLYDCVGHIQLRHTDPGQIAKDHEAIRSIERRLFDELVTPAGTENRAPQLVSG